MVAHCHLSLSINVLIVKEEWKSRVKGSGIKGIQYSFRLTRSPIQSCFQQFNIHYG